MQGELVCLMYLLARILPNIRLFSFLLLSRSWLSTLGREISGVVHGGAGAGGGGSTNNNNSNSNSRSFAPKSASSATDELLLLSSAHRTFGTPLQNQQQQQHQHLQLHGNTAAASTDSVLDALLQKL